MFETGMRCRLKEVDSRIASLRLHIAAQQLRIELQRLRGYDITLASNVINSFRETLRLFQNRRRQIQEEIALEHRRSAALALDPSPTRASNELRGQDSKFRSGRRVARKHASGVRRGNFAP